MSSLILASTSPYRRQLLQRLGLAFECLAPDCDEEALKDPRLAPAALAESLAVAKARSIAPQYPGACVIGSDQVACLDDAILGKPGSRERAIAQLSQLQGRTHALLTAVCVIAPDGSEQVFHDRTELDMLPFDTAALARYVDRDQPFDCAGAYKLEAGGIGLFAAIRSADHSAITGLPLLALAAHLRTLGFVIP